MNPRAAMETYTVRPNTTAATMRDAEKTTSPLASVTETTPQTTAAMENPTAHHRRTRSTSSLRHRFTVPLTCTEGHEGIGVRTASSPGLQWNGDAQTFLPGGGMGGRRTRRRFIPALLASGSLAIR